MRSADALGKALRGKLAKIVAEMGECSLYEIKSDEGLKANIIDDPLFEIEIISPDAFTVSASPKDICRSLLRDYYYGCARVKIQWRNAGLLADEKSVAWALVSAYYCSFFGAIEALRVCGNHLLSLSRAEASQVFATIGGPDVHKILEKSNFRGVVSEDFSRIGYTANGGKPHQTTWRYFNSVVLPIFPRGNASWVEIEKFKNICKGENGWEAPSDIRNRWNYRDSLYFSGLGDSSESPFLRLIKDGDAASSWIRGAVSIRNEKDSAASIASLSQLLRGAIEDSYEFGFLSFEYFNDGV